jgi:hypothetical protein
MAHRPFAPVAGLMSSALVLWLSACTAPDAATDTASGLAFANQANEASQLAGLRQVTSLFHNFDAADAAGYSTRITPCWAHHSNGAMGYHYGKTSLFDANVELLEPEVLMYEPQAGGHLRLVGMEYIVPLDAWAAAGHDLKDPNDVPELLGQKYTQHSFLPIFKLHIWLWRNNPQGTFVDWNAKVSCDHAAEVEVF